MEFYIDLEKATLNTAKLVRRPVQVRGKNGKVFTRMQWVDPRTGQPVSQGHSTKQEEQPKQHVGAKEEEGQPTQKQHIDAKIKKMSREEKYHHLNKHGITWTPNHHPAIDHKNAMMALKEHFYKNPHLLGAEHLPTEGTGAVSKDDEIKQFMDAYKKHGTMLYDLMNHLGVIDDPTDPRTVDGQQSKSEGGNGMGAIKHMKNMMALKKFLKDSPHHMDSMKQHPVFGIPHGNATASTTAAPAPKKPTAQNKAQKGGNNIQGILKSMAREDIYGLMKKLGIADRDPKDDPSVEDKMKPIAHMRNMMKLKSAIEKDPSLLNTHPDTGELDEDEKARIAGLEGKEKRSHDADEFLKRASRGLKNKWAKDYEDHDIMKNRKTNGNEHIDNMHKISALKKLFTEHPDLMKKHEHEVENEELMNMKIGNKMMGKILRQVVGLKGVGDVANGFKKHKQWEWGVASTAEIMRDDEGEPILSIIDAGEDGEEWNEKAIPLKDVKKFIDGLKEGKTEEVKTKEVPLHKKPPNVILDKLSEDFDANYTPEVGEALKVELYNMWDKGGRNDTAFSIAKQHSNYMHTDTMIKLLDKLGIKCDSRGKFKIDDDFKKALWSHKIETTKNKNAMDYLEVMPGVLNDHNDTWVLHESAKHWSPEERSSARMDFIKGTTEIHLDGVDQADRRESQLHEFVHKSLEHVPFDLFTDTIASGFTFNFKPENSHGKPHLGNHHTLTSSGHAIYFDHNYVLSPKLLTSSHPLEYKPDNRTHPVLGTTYGLHPFADTCAHEFAHAIDCYLSGGRDYCHWETERADKYALGHNSVIGDSYKAAIKRSNPDKRVFMVNNGRQKYPIHLDEWSSNYEGRIYDHAYMGSAPSIEKRADGALVDKHFGNSSEMGIEHWSENVSRLFNAVSAYREWQKDNYTPDMGIDEWAENMFRQAVAFHGIGDDSNKGERVKLKDPNDGEEVSYLIRNNFRDYRRSHPDLAYGYAYHVQKQRHPELHEAMHKMLLRPDFLEGNKDTRTPVDYAKLAGDDVRKSEVGLYIKL